jgi:hypothetical protein
VSGFIMLSIFLPLMGTPHNYFRVTLKIKWDHVHAILVQMFNNYYQSTFAVGDKDLD